MKMKLSELRGVIRSIIVESVDEGVPDKDELISVYSDVYKEKHGIRPRWMMKALNDMSVKDVQDALDELYKESPTVDYSDFTGEPVMQSDHDPKLSAVSNVESDHDDAEEVVEPPTHLGMGRGHDDVEKGRRFIRSFIESILREAEGDEGEPKSSRRKGKYATGGLPHQYIDAAMGEPISGEEEEGSGRREVAPARSVLSKPHMHAVPIFDYALENDPDLVETTIRKLLDDSIDRLGKIPSKGAVKEILGFRKNLPFIPNDAVPFMVKGLGEGVKIDELINDFVSSKGKEMETKAKSYERIAAEIPKGKIESLRKVLTKYFIGTEAIRTAGGVNLNDLIKEFESVGKTAISKIEGIIENAGGSSGAFKVFDKTAGEIKNPVKLLKNLKLKEFSEELEDAISDLTMMFEFLEDDLKRTGFPGIEFKSTDINGLLERFGERFDFAVNALGMSQSGPIAASGGGEAQASIKPLPLPTVKDFKTLLAVLREEYEKISEEFDEIREKFSFIHDVEFEQKEMLSKESDPRLKRVQTMLAGGAKSLSDLNIPETRELVIKFLSEKFSDKLPVIAKAYINDKIVPRFQEIKDQIEGLDPDDENAIRTVFEEGNKLFDNAHAIVRAYTFPDLNEVIGEEYPDKKLQGEELARWIVAKLSDSRD